VNKRINIAFFGSSLLSAYWNGAATYYRGLLHALSDCGHHITFYEPDAYGRQQHRDISDPDWARVVVYSANGFDDVSRALEDAGNADLIVKASGVGVFDEWLERSVLELHHPGKVVAFWDVDAPATVHRVRTNPQDPFGSLIKRYDLIFIYGGGKPVVCAYHALGARLCVPIYNALDPLSHFPVEQNSNLAGDLGFLGNRLPDREARIDEFFFSVARALPDCAFFLGGNGWDDKPMPHNIRYLGHVYTHQHNAFNCSQRAVLNVNRQSMTDFGFSPPTRLFEAAGVGACLITDHWDGIEIFLEPKAEVLVARNGTEVADHLRSLSSARAREIGAAARRRILAEHTYAHRAVQVETALGLKSQRS
jgi:spore maturation protein CgeB